MSEFKHEIFIDKSALRLSPMVIIKTYLTPNLMPLTIFLSLHHNHEFDFYLKNSSLSYKYSMTFLIVVDFIHREDKL